MSGKQGNTLLKHPRLNIKYKILFLKISKDFHTQNIGLPQNEVRKTLIDMISKVLPLLQNKIIS